MHRRVLYERARPTSSDLVRPLSLSPASTDQRELGPEPTLHVAVMDLSTAATVLDLDLHNKWQVLLVTMQAPSP